MFAVIRHYEQVAPPVAASVVAAGAQIDALLGAVPGAHGSLLIRTRDGLALVALGADEWCLAESGRRFRAWADANVAGFRMAVEATVWVGEVVGPRVVQPAFPGSAEGADPSPGR